MSSDPNGASATAASERDYATLSDTNKRKVDALIAKLKAQEEAENQGVGAAASRHKKSKTETTPANSASAGGGGSSMMSSLDGTAPTDYAGAGGGLSAPQAQQPPAYRGLSADPQPVHHGMGSAQQLAYRSLTAPVQPAPPAAPPAQATGLASLAECAEKLSPQRMTILHEVIDRLSRTS